MVLAGELIANDMKALKDAGGIVPEGKHSKIKAEVEEIMKCVGPQCEDVAH
jgi:hypothetical protein